MFSTIVCGVRALRICLCGLAVAGLLLGAAFTSDLGSQCRAAGQGGGHHSSGHKGHKARAKRHGPKQHHARHHAAKKHRHAKRREHPSHKPHGKHSSHHGSSEITHSSTTDITHHHNAWDYYWGHHNYLDNSDVVGSQIVTSGVIAERAFDVVFYTPEHHVEEFLAATREKAKEKVLLKYADAVIRSIEEKPVIHKPTTVTPTSIVEKAFVVKFYAPKYHVEEILAVTRDKAKEKAIARHAGAVFSVDEKSAIYPNVK